MRLDHVGRQPSCINKDQHVLTDHARVSMLTQMFVIATSDPTKLL